MRNLTVKSKLKVSLCMAFCPFLNLYTDSLFCFWFDWLVLQMEVKKILSAINTDFPNVENSSCVEDGKGTK